MRFWVSVPVLSVQITVVLPSVSTTGRRRTTVRRRAIRATPMARVMVTAAGRPSGIAPTASATAAVNVLVGSSPRHSPTAKVSAASPRISTVSCLLNVSSLRVSGVDRDVAVATSRWIEPSSVCSPVPTTTPVPLPWTTDVLANTVLRRSATGVASGRTAGSLDAGSDSPVRVDSSTLSSTCVSSRASAGTSSPARSRTRSPGTSPAASTTSSRPSRTTRACVRTRDRRDSSAASARDSCRKPMVALTTTTAVMTAEST